MLLKTYIHCDKRHWSRLSATSKRPAASSRQSIASTAEIQQQNNTHVTTVSHSNINVLVFGRHVDFSILSHWCAFCSAPHPQWLRIPHTLDADLAMELAVSWKATAASGKAAALSEAPAATEQIWFEMIGCCVSYLMITAHGRQNKTKTQSVQLLAQQPIHKPETVAFWWRHWGGYVQDQSTFGDVEQMYLGLFYMWK